MESKCYQPPLLAPNEHERPHPPLHPPEQLPEQLPEHPNEHERLHPPEHPPEHPKLQPCISSAFPNMGIFDKAIAHRRGSAPLAALLKNSRRDWSSSFFLFFSIFIRT